MTRTELIIQLLKVAIALAFGAYFVWWSLQVLDRLTPEYGAATAVVARATAPCSATEPADLPVQVPGPEIPPTLIARADEVIEWGASSWRKLEARGETVREVWR